MGMAFASTLAAEESFTTVELKINFFRPVWEARLQADGRVVRRGSPTGYVECEIKDESGHLIAKASSTCMVLRGDRAKGRYASITHVDDTKHSVSCGFLAILRCDSCLCEEGGRYFRSQGGTGSRLRYLQS